MGTGNPPRRIGSRQSKGASLPAIAELLERHRVKRVPVLRDGRVVGIVSRADLVRALARAPSEMTDSI